MMIKQCILKNGEEITVKACTKDDLGELLELQQEVIASLTTDSFLQPLSEEEFLNIITGNGLMIGAFHSGELIAFRALLIPKADEEDHLGKDAGIAEEEWAQVIYSEVSNVKPSFRGNGLQKLLGKIIIDEIDRKKFRYLCATVAPFNIASLLDKFAHGMYIIALKEKYQHMLRYILLKDFAHAPNVENGQSTFVQMDDTHGQQKLLEDGWIGTNMKNVDGEWLVEFRNRRQ